MSRLLTKPLVQPTADGLCTLRHHQPHAHVSQQLRLAADSPWPGCASSSLR